MSYHDLCYAFSSPSSTEEHRRRGIRFTLALEIVFDLARPANSARSLPPSLSQAADDDDDADTEELTLSLELGRLNTAATAPAAELPLSESTDIARCAAATGDSPKRACWAK
jgi:hypothetical protein